MSLTALRQAALSSRRTYTMGEKLEAKRPDGDQDARKDSWGDRTRREADGSVAVEPHWWAMIELATD